MRKRVTNIHPDILINFSFFTISRIVSNKMRLFSSQNILLIVYLMFFIVSLILKKVPHKGFIC